MRAGGGELSVSEGENQGEAKSELSKGEAEAE